MKTINTFNIQTQPLKLMDDAVLDDSPPIIRQQESAVKSERQEIKEVLET